MPFIAYIPKRFHGKSEKLIHQANGILDEYAALGLSLTLRQLYLRLVACDAIADSFRAYKNFQSRINEARLAGRIDWLHFQLFQPSKPANLSVEVWGDNQPLLSTLARASSQKIPFVFHHSHAGNGELWAKAQRLISHRKPVTIIHLSDVAGSFEDLQNRLTLFEVENARLVKIDMGGELESVEPALLHEQIAATIEKHLL